MWFENKIIYKGIVKMNKHTIRQNPIPDDILKIQKKLCEYKIDSRNYKKYNKILAKHVKNFTMKQRINSHIKTIERLEELSN
jgi:hypothetical protein